MDLRYVLKMNKRLTFLLLLLALVFFTNLFFLLDIPPVWPDEALHADLVLNILNRGMTGTNLLSGTLPGVETFGFGYPPLYFYTSALWFKIFGFSIFIYRLLSFSLGLIFLVIFAMVSLKLLNRNIAVRTNYLRFLLLVILLLLLIVDIAFIKAIHIARPEIEVLVLGFLSVFFYLKVSETKEKRKRILFSILSGLSLGLAFITHYLAVIFLISLVFYIVISNFKHFYKQKEFYAFSLAFLSILIVWIISIYPYRNYFLNIVTLQLSTKTNNPHWIWVVFGSGSLLTKIVYLLYLIIGWELAVNFLPSKNHKALLLLSLGLTSWILTYMWQIEYSFVYTVIFTYLSLFYLLVNNLEMKDSLSKVKFKAYLLISAILLVINTFNLVNLLKQFQGDNFSYQVFSDSIKPLIPKGASVYISSIPDPYFVLYGTNKLVEFPILPIQEQDLEKVLSDVDYIVFNSPLENLVSGNVVMPYIQNNADEIKNVGQPGQYKAIVVKLKPKELRVKNKDAP